MAKGDANALEGELEQQSEWMRRLVRRLVRDAADADDVVQAAHLAALRRGRTGAPAERGWLARVALNFARRQRRDEMTRRGHELAAARGASQAPADELVARLDAQRALTEELRALPEPYRSTLVRSFFDGWSAARIARESGCPATTVRTRIERGLELLRERLDRRSGGRREWLAALAPLAAPRLPPWLDLPSAPVTNLVQGVLLMKASLPVVATLAITAVVGVAWLWNAPQNDPATPEIELATPAPRVASPRGEDSDAPSTASTAVRAAIGSPTTIAAAQTAPVEVAPTQVEARVVDARHQPLSARVELEDFDAAFARTDGDGRVVLNVEGIRAPQVATLRIEAVGFAPRLEAVTLSPERTTRLGDLVLERAAAVAGRVEGLDGRPIAGARVMATPTSYWSADLESAKRCGPATDQGVPTTHGAADGSFLLEGVAPGGAHLWAAVEGMRYGVTAPLVLRSDEVLRNVLLVVEPLRREDEITGVVLTPEGEAAAGVSLHVSTRSGGNSHSWSIAVHPDGRFRFRVRLPADHKLSAVDGADRWPRVALEGVAPGARDVELRFTAPRYVVATAHSAGRPIARFALHVVAEADQRTLQRVGAGESADGRSRIRIPSEPFFVECRAPGHSIARLGPFRPSSTPSSMAFELDTEEGLTGRVLAAASPVAGARVTLWRVAAATEGVQVGGYPALLDPQVADETVSDADGSYFLRVERAGEYVVRAQSAGFVASELGPLAAHPGQAQAGLDLTLGAGGRIEGRVVVAEGRSLAGVIVVANRGDGRPRTTRTDASGGFAFEGLSVGRWAVERGRTEATDSALLNWAISASSFPTKLPFNCDVREGETSYVVVELTDERPARVNGRLTVNSAPAAGWTVCAWPGDVHSFSGELPNTALDEHGEFTLSLDDPGLARLEFAWPAQGDSKGLVSAVLRLERGDNLWSHELVTTRVEGRSARPSSEEYALFLRVEGAGVRGSIPIHTRDDGLFVLPAAPVGRATFVGVSISNGRWDERSTLAELDLVRGATAFVELP